MAAPDFDLIVIGAGPAGSCAAAFARMAGLSVCVVEKEEFPRFRIGESMLPAGNAVLRAAGVWPKLEAAGFIPKYGARFHLGDGTMEKRVDFSTGVVPGLDSTFQVERARFDALLLDHARSLGAETRLRTSVVAVRPEPEIIAVETESASAAQQTLTARWLIDAGGRDNLYTSEGKRRLDPPALTRRIAIYNHFRGLPRSAGRPGGDTIVVRLDDGWFWIIPIDDERTSVGLVTTTEAVRQAGGDPKAVFERTVAGAPRLREMFADAEPTMDFRVTADYSYFRQQLAYDRIVLTGDAAGFFDPIFSSGVYMATSSAQLAVAAIARAHRAGRALKASEQRHYTAAVKKQARTFRRLIEAFYDNDSFAVFLSPSPPLDLGPGITSIVAGHARLTWPLWWRFHIFLAVCWLQKRFALVPPIKMPFRVAPPATPAAS